MPETPEGTVCYEVYTFTKPEGEGEIVAVKRFDHPGEARDYWQTQKLTHADIDLRRAIFRSKRWTSESMIDPPPTREELNGNRPLFDAVTNSAADL